MGILKSAGLAESIDALRRSASGGGRGGRSAQLFLKSDSSVKVRFLQEPTQFMEYLEHWDEEKKKFVPAIDNDPLDQHPNERTRRTSKRWLANVLNVEDGRVHIVKLNQDQINRLLTRFTRYGTLLDRNYELIRNGSGRDSRYDVDSDDPTQMDLSKFTPRCHDLYDFLLGEVDEYHDTTFQEEYRREKEQQSNGQTAPADAMEAIKPALDPEAAKAQAAAQKIAELDEKYGEAPPWSDSDGADNDLPLSSTSPASATAPPATPPSTTGGTTPPTPAAEPMGMAEVAAATEAAKLAAVPDPAPAAEVDPWVLAKQNGQPCVKGDDDKCAICGFPVTECLMAK